MATSRATPTPEFSTYPLVELRALWKQGELTETQMVGHLLQHVFNLDKRVYTLEQPPRADAGRPASTITRK
jgi:hypothetical protein